MPPIPTDRLAQRFTTPLLLRRMSWLGLVDTGHAWAHGVAHGPPAPSLWSAWTLDPLVLAPLIISALLYWRGLHAAWRRRGVGHGVGRWEAASFAGGMAALFLALVWPLDVLGEHLFSVHMAQHLLLMNLAAPLLVLGAPVPTMLRALPRGWRRRLGRAASRRAWRSAWRLLSGVTAATLAQQVVLWGWHTPRGVAAALERDAVHIAMHLSLIAAALLFWTAVLQARARGLWASVAALVLTVKVGGTICILLLANPAVRYPAYGESAAAWGLSAAEDEQIGWGLMMVAGTIGYLGPAIALAARALRPHRQRRAPPAAWAARDERLVTQRARQRLAAAGLRGPQAADPTTR